MENWQSTLLTASLFTPLHVSSANSRQLDSVHLLCSVGLRSLSAQNALTGLRRTTVPGNVTQILPTLSVAVMPFAVSHFRGPPPVV